jgi:hypothetical protein
MCIFAYGITSNIEVFEEPVDPFNARPDSGIEFHSGISI